MNHVVQRFFSTAAFVLTVPAAALAQQPLKAGFIYFDPVGNAGWTYQHDTGRLEMEKALAGKVTSVKVESVNGQDAAQVMQSMIGDGTKLIFTVGFDYMEPTLRVARDNPGVSFMNATGYKQSGNAGSYNARFYEGRYLAGIVAGRMSKSGVAGYVAAIPIPEVVQGVNAFARGMRSVNPKAEVKVVMINAWFDPPKERDAAISLINLGVDVVTHHTNSVAVVQAADSRGVHSIGYHSDMSKFAPKKSLTATVHEWGPYYTDIAKRALAGTWKPTNDWLGVKEGVVKLAPFGPEVPPSVRQEVARATEAIATGKLHPFDGPVVDQDGQERQKPGTRMTDDALQRMNYYVQGVSSRFPRQ
ncbi:BMP family ABC transporter substrate-binding protein [Hydrogenophaga sp. 2FB]|uniref:BMP family ABC transporter substrate-binding protein n=1 Tax=Hydrogenophaga sp. 2FB TaxID=2502187 RepID=UPI0010FA477B|nr:BMP family ABC transporter substrate-binding protein [Hydrogenophaga sp. 2FB]